VVVAALAGLASAAAGQGIRVVSDGEEVIDVQTAVRITTTVVVPEGESIIDVVAGDAEYWDVSAAGNIAYIKPLSELARTNVTLVGESGQVWALVVTEAGDAEPDLVVYIEPTSSGTVTLGRQAGPAVVAAAALGAQEREIASARAELQALGEAAARELEAERARQAAEAGAWLEEYPGRLEFPYRLEERAQWAPFLVEGMWHDGRFTYLRSRAQETPALYEFTDGEPVLVSYELYDDGLFVADRVLGPGRLVIGERWVEWKDRRFRPWQPWSVKRRIWTVSLVVAGAFGGAWLLRR
jgi:type IV secretion system protein VirB9